MHAVGRPDRRRDRHRPSRRTGVADLVASWVIGPALLPQVPANLEDDARLAPGDADLAS